MTLDTRIALQGRLPEIEGPLDVATKFGNYKNLLAQGQMNEMKMQNALQERQDAEALRGAYAQNKDPAQLLDALRQVSPTAYREEATFQGTQQKAAREADKAKLEQGLKHFEIAGQIMGGVKDEATYQMARQQAAQLFGPEAVAKMPPNYDPAAIEQARAQAMTVKDQMEQQWKAKGYDLDVAKFGESARHNKTSEGLTARGQNITMRGQNMTDARGREMALIGRETNAVAREGINAKRVTDLEMKLADDYTKQSKGYQEVSGAVKKIESTLGSASTSAAATLAAATSFMKLLDPGSVVRESELGMALAASGVIDRMKNYHNTLLNGKVLTPDQVKDFRKITGQIHEAAKQSQKQIDASYKGRAKQYGLNADNIVSELGQSESTAGFKSVTVGGKSLSARQAPNGKFYVEQGGKFFEVQ